MIIKSESHKIRIDIISRPYENADNIWDLNWLVTDLEIKIPGFTAKYSLYTTTNDFVRFYEELSNLHQSLEGKAEFVTIESGIYLKATIERKTGKLIWNVESQYPQRDGAILEFEFQSDQSYIYETIRELKDIIKQYPVLSL